MENFQDEGGRVAVPAVLQQFGAPPAIGRYARAAAFSSGFSAS
jgi:seryl-tRNA synthetase